MPWSFSVAPDEAPADTTPDTVGPPAPGPVVPQPQLSPGTVAARQGFVDFGQAPVSPPDYHPRVVRLQQPPVPERVVRLKPGEYADNEIHRAENGNYVTQLGTEFPTTPSRPAWYADMAASGFGHLVNIVPNVANFVTDTVPQWIESKVAPDYLARSQQADQLKAQHNLDTYGPVWGRRLNAVENIGGETTDKLTQERMTELGLREAEPASPTRFDEMLGRGVEGGVSNLPLTLTGVGPIRAVARGFLGGATGEAARQGAQSLGFGPTGQGLADFLFSNIGAGAALRGANPTVSATAKAFEDIGGTPPVRLVAQESPYGIGSTINRFNPFIGKDQAIASWNRAFLDSADNASTLQGADKIGDAVKNQVSQWSQDRLAARSNIEGQINKSDAPITLNDGNGFAPSPGSAGLPDIMRNNQGTGVLDRIDTSGGRLSFGAADYMKDEVGAFTGTREFKRLPQADKDQVIQLYNDLKQHSYSVADSQIPGAGAKLAAIDDSARDYMKLLPRQVKQIEDNQVNGSQVLKKIINGTDPDANNLKQLVDQGAITDDMHRAIAGNFMREFGTNPTTGFPDIKRFAKEYNGLSDAAKTNVFGSLRPQMDNLGKVADIMTKNPKMAPNTGYKYLFQKFGGMGGAVLAAGGIAGEHFMEKLPDVVQHLTPEGIAAGTAGAATLAAFRLMSSKPVVNFLSKPVTSMDRFNAGLVNIARLSNDPQFKSDINTVVRQGQ